MRLTLTSLHDLASLEVDEIIDVRSPAEFAEDHLPGAINLPVLDNDERAEVGTIYVQDSRFRARRIGAAKVARNAARHLEGPLSGRDGSYRPLVYCWRGGQRSGSFATILEQVGWRVSLLEGGYQTYRRLVHDALYDDAFPCPVVVLDGNTGSAKTELLNLLPGHGVQVIDLEGLANHRGSIFGARHDGQPSQKWFESQLAQAISQLDPARPVVVEAESSRVGDRTVPPILWNAMKAAPRIEIAAPLTARAAYLVRAYGDVIADQAQLVDTLRRLAPFHAGEVIAEWVEMAGAGRNEALAAGLMAAHYDPRYGKQRARQDGSVAEVLAVDGLDAASLEAAAARLAGLVQGRFQ